MADTDVQTCQACGASVYPEHIQAQRAGHWGGKLYCVQCFAEHKRAQVTIDPNDFGAAGEPNDIPLSQPVDNDSDTDEEMEAELVDDVPEPAEGITATDVPEVDGQAIEFASLGAAKIQPFAGTTPQRQQHADDRKYKRHPNRSGKGAIRCRIFHAKLNDGALKFMEDQINEWMDSNPDIEIKHTGTQVGVVEGKSAEPHLILTLFY